MVHLYCWSWIFGSTFSIRQVNNCCASDVLLYLVTMQKRDMIKFHHKTSQEVSPPKNTGYFLKAEDIQILVHPAVPPEILQKEFSNFTHVTKIIKHFFFSKTKNKQPRGPHRVRIWRPWSHSGNTCRASGRFQISGSAVASSQRKNLASKYHEQAYTDELVLFRRKSVVTTNGNLLALCCLVVALCLVHKAFVSYSVFLF